MLSRVYYYGFYLVNKLFVTEQKIFFIILKKVEKI